MASAAGETDLANVTIGIIGMGEMGKMYAERLNKGGLCKCINVCDLPQKYAELQVYCKGKQKLVAKENGHAVARESDFIIYSVEAEYLEQVVKQYGPSTKFGAIVSGQTSVKAPERAAFEQHLNSDVQIVSIHSLHGPSVPPDGQALIMIKHRAQDSHVKLVEKLLAPLNSRYIHLSYDEHDEVTANTQAVTHAAFLSMGTAWKSMTQFPWQTGRYTGGIEIVKTNIALRIYAAKWHVYAGLAILNPMARKQINQYAKSVSDLFKLAGTQQIEQLRQRIFQARDFVFPQSNETENPILLSDRILDQFAIGDKTAEGEGSAAPPNSHLSLLAMVDCWHILKIRPFDHLAIAGTPVFRFWIGVAEYLFRSEERLQQAINAAVYDKSHFSDDLEFCLAAKGWSDCVNYGNFDSYRQRFEETAQFFEPRFEESRVQNGRMFALLKSDAVKANN